ncbi:hypothetical protein F183_A26900 [Bryobacterales bacterium F-183]|nr:hypothetical protein F183_A26900 [Bryobacterales bacterium F-183]
MKVYMDVCCVSRLTDDQSQARIREEAEAVELVLAGVRHRTVQLISSEALEDEVWRNPSIERRVEALWILSLAAVKVQIDEVIVLRARRLVEAGYGPFDALHIACVESAQANVLLTTDDRLLRQASRGLGRPQVSVQNPVLWIRERSL